MAIIDQTNLALQSIRQTALANHVRVCVDALEGIDEGSEVAEVTNTQEG